MAPSLTPSPSPVVAAVGQASSQPTPQPLDQPHLGYGVQLAEAKNMALAVQGGFAWAKHDLNIRKETNFLTNADNLLSDLRKSNTENVLLKLVVWTEALMLNTSAW